MPWRRLLWLLVFWAHPAWAEEPVEIDGFRSALFGMTEPQLRSAILDDFHVDDILKAKQPVEGTTILAIANLEVLEGAPPATVTYILGARSDRLIQINVVWGERNPLPADRLLPTGHLLISFFLAKGSYQPGSVAVNQSLSDGGVLLFRGGDAAGHMVLLKLLPVGDRATLRLSYMQTLRNPDVRAIDKKQF